jgi:hypothetical protein
VLRYSEATFTATPPQYRSSRCYLENAEHVELIRKIQTQDSVLFRRVVDSPNPNPSTRSGVSWRRVVEGQMADW